MGDEITNVMAAGLGGQGVLTASDIVAEAAFAAGLDVKKSEVRGMGRRGGSVCADVRFGRDVLSPMIPLGEVDFFLLLDAELAEAGRGLLRAGGVLIAPEAVEAAALPHRRSLNVALVGVLSRYLPFEVSVWHEAMRNRLSAERLEANLRAFAIGRETGVPKSLRHSIRESNPAREPEL
jgi:indolepyruvate ferredoxin oxidoreductase, beta subunit